MWQSDASVRNAELTLSVPSSCQLSSFVVQSNPVQTKCDLSFSNYLANAKSKIFYYFCVVIIAGSCICPFALV